MQRPRSKSSASRPAVKARSTRRPSGDPVADALERTADAVASLDDSLKRVEKKLDRLINLSGERHIVIGERLAAVEKTGKAVSKSLEGLTAVVKTNNELARQSHHHVVSDLGLVKARVTKVESDLEAKKERATTAGRVEKV